jgi:hypothetical protein
MKVDVRDKKIWFQLGHRLKPKFVIFPKTKCTIKPKLETVIYVFP